MLELAEQQQASGQPDQSETCSSFEALLAKSPGIDAHAGRERFVDPPAKLRPALGMVEQMRPMLRTVARPEVRRHSATLRRFTPPVATRLVTTRRPNPARRVRGSLC